MWHKNTVLYRTPLNLTVTADMLAESLSACQFTPCGELEQISQGFSPVFRDQLTMKVGEQISFKYTMEKRLLPTSVVNEAVKVKAKEIEEQSGFRPGRKALKELKEKVIDELLPKSHCVKSETAIWLDLSGGWLAIDTSSVSKAEDVLKLFFKCVNYIPLESIKFKLSPESAMTDWLIEDSVPVGLTIDKDIEFSGTQDGKVRYVKETLDPEDAKKLIAAGKQCTMAALTWRDKVSFVLTSKFVIKRIKPLNISAENNDVANTSDERQEADFALMAGELGSLFADLMVVLQEDKTQYTW